ncbi:MAG: glycosyltransferase family 2 protein, partial [Patescibacteria group bacterium]
MSLRGVLRRSNPCISEKKIASSSMTPPRNDKKMSISRILLRYLLLLERFLIKKGMKILAVIPAYKEATTIADVLERTRPFVSEMIVVNDGSPDETAEVALKQDAIVVSHLVNRGLGAAIGTGFAVAKMRKADVVITLDADGQHDPSEIPKFLEAIENGADVVIGSRMLSRTGMPWYRQAANFLGNFSTLILFGVYVTDSQSGFRAFSRAALEKIEIKTNRMEVSSELIAE